MSEVVKVLGVIIGFARLMVAMITLHRSNRDKKENRPPAKVKR